ncbi:hypothetical protein CEF21_17535 [Bacillus sp. FJAT-42376]|nr:hypothetical protein CEF21_17535 [Bacillus sp. FJAT-42376]
MYKKGRRILSGSLFLFEQGDEAKGRDSAGAAGWLRPGRRLLSPKRARALKRTYWTAPRSILAETETEGGHY